MSQPGARRRRSRRSAPTAASRIRRPLVALASVILVITPISWILLHEPQSDQADASVPYVTRDDDTYITASNEPVTEKSDPPSTKASPTPRKTPGTPKPSGTPDATPSGDPTRVPTAGPSDDPTQGPTDDPSSDGPGDPKPTTKPTTKPTRTPTGEPTSPIPADPADDGSMTAPEVELFSLIDNERQSRGCAPLDRNSTLTGGARNEAENRAGSGEVSSTGDSKASAGGDDMSAQAAFNRLKSESAGTVFDCGLTELGVGRGDSTRKDGGVLCGIGIGCSTKTRVAWVVDFK